MLPPPSPPPPQQPPVQQQQLNCDHLFDNVVMEEYMLKEIWEILNEGSQPLSVICPSHDKEMTYNMSSHNWFRYVKCPVEPCPFFSSEEDAVAWSDGIFTLMYPDYKMLRNPEEATKFNWKCKCEVPSWKTFKLSQSQSVRNPGRFYLRCPENRCNFFAWLDTPWNEHQRNEWDPVEREQRGLHPPHYIEKVCYRPPHPLQYRPRPQPYRYQPPRSQSSYGSRGGRPQLQRGYPCQRVPINCLGFHLKDENDNAVYVLTEMGFCSLEDTCTYGVYYLQNRHLPWRDAEQIRNIQNEID